MTLSALAPLVPMLALLLVGPVAVAAPQPITTRSAQFEPMDFAALPGWGQESHVEALRAFTDACGKLRTRPLWGPICKEAAAQAKHPAVARRFFETRFTAWRVTDRQSARAPVRDRDAAADPTEGLLTGYFEPILLGRKQRGGRFIHPVYGPPPSLLHLDARTLAPFAGQAAVAAIIKDRQVIPVRDGAPPEEPVYRLALDLLGAEPLDRRYRLRRDGDRLVPYYPRDQIESAAQPLGPVIAWVDDADALYVMQVQGSGRIRLADRTELRLAYADQNGQPFTPRGAPAATTRTRNIGGDGSAGLSPSLLSLIAGGGAASGAQPATEAGSAVAPSRPAGARTRSIAERNDPAVERVIRDLLESSPPPPAASATPLPTATATVTSVPVGTAASNVLPPRNNPRFAAIALAHLARARGNDRSYVFFRVRTDSATGPPGALGVPLTAGRSLAVDPRVTPLGAPVFIEAKGGVYEVPIRRLTVAQDTGGAIRGPVRADFFWGSGPAAGAQALQTRDVLAMWVLLPKGFLESRAPSTRRTRSVDLGGGAPADAVPGGGAPGAIDCTAPDDDYCDD